MTQRINPKVLIPQETIRNKILLLRGKKVMLDRDLAKLYGVETKHLTRQVRRNKSRFPADFLLTLITQEVANLKCQFGTSSWGGTRKPPFAFTEHGILMLSSILNSERAVQVNIQIMRTFTKLREMLTSHKELKRKIEEMEKKYDYRFKVVFKAIKELIESPRKFKRRIGFHP
ncbi:MAG: ORF6N domain-containing protein [Candidatus Omnitrophica bacterium]|nr:ORF6N domain-containing protein [Candidatus Omnitrophota bacterium]